MHVYHGLNEIPPTIRAALSVGKFDGVHIGHQSIIQALRRTAQELDATSAILTFDPHPQSFFHPERPLRLLTSLPERLERLGQLGVDAVIVLPFTCELAAMSAEEFVRKILVKKLHIVAIHTGCDFRFGRLAEAGCTQLAEFGKKYGFHVRVHAPVCVDNHVVSSSWIRALRGVHDYKTARRGLSRADNTEAQ